MRAVLAGVLLVILAGSGAVAQPFDPRERPADERLGPSIRAHRFSNVPQVSPIPGSDGAALCALTLVDDDTARGFCRVFYDPTQGVWMHQTGGAGNDNQCEATCLWVRGPGLLGEALQADRDPAPREPTRPRRQAGGSERGNSGPVCRPPRYHRFVLREPVPLPCGPERIDVFGVTLPDGGNALARATLSYADSATDPTGLNSASHFWNTGVQVGNGNAIQIGDDICPGDRTPPKPVLGFGRLEAGQNTGVRVTSTSGGSQCVPGGVVVLPGSRLEVWVEDPDPACRGRDVGFASTLDVPQFRTEEGWRWTGEDREMLHVRIPPGQPNRTTLTVMAALEATPRQNPNRVCGREGAGALASLVSDETLLEQEFAPFPASQGMGHVVFGLSATIREEVADPRRVSLWARTNAPPSAEVFTGGCCGEAMIGFVRE